MKKTLRIYQVNAFTHEVFKGNPAGVVANADGLSADQMQAIARELNNSETAFIFHPSDPSHEFKVRFFTPTVEVPSCGHASISAGFIWSKENGFNRTSFRQKIQIGVLPIKISTENGKQLVYMTQGNVEFGEPIEGPLKEKILNALGIFSSDIIDELPIQCVSTGHGKVIVPLKSKQILNCLKPNYTALAKLSDVVGQNGFFPFVFNDNYEEILTHARMFAPKIGINEDPVTGNGNGPMGAYLVYHKAVEYLGNRLEFVSRQGEAMNRMGHAHVKVDIDNGKPVKVQVGGECVVAFETSMILEVQNEGIVAT